MTEDGARNRGLLLLLMVGTVVAAGPAAMGQAGAAAGTKTPAFDVVSIKPNNSGYQGGSWGVSKNQYRAKNTPLNRIILQAYLGSMSPSSDRLKGAPSWVSTEPYDITAKVDDATADSWKDMRQAQQVAIAAPMLKAMLEDRCKLVAHTVPTEILGYALVVGKHGMKMKVAQPDEPRPTTGYATFGEGWMMVPIRPGPDAKQSVTYLQITMAQFTEFLSVSGLPVLDQTGLAGKYDFELPKYETNPPEEGAPPGPFPDAAHMFNWEAIGLEMKPIKVPALDVVVDHIERPTPN